MCVSRWHGEVVGVTHGGQPVKYPQGGNNKCVLEEVGGEKKGVRAERKTRIPSAGRAV